MRESEEALKKNTIGPQQHPMRSVACQHADDVTREPQNDSAPTSSQAVDSSAPSSAQPATEIDTSAVQDTETGIQWVREELSFLVR